MTGYNLNTNESITNTRQNLTIRRKITNIQIKVLAQQDNIILTTS